MNEIGSCIVMYNVQEASAARTKLALFVSFCVCMSPDSSALAIASLLEIGIYYITMHCCSPVKKL